MTTKVTGGASVRPEPFLEMEELAAELEFSRGVYDMLARLYYAPLDDGEVSSLASTDLTWEVEGSPLMREGLDEMRRCLEGVHPTLRQDLNIDFTSAFYAVNQYEGKVAAPYESVFRSEDGLLFQKPHGEVFRSYKRESLKVDPDVNLPADHLSFELQFLGHLCDRAAEALRTGDDERACELLERQAAFLREHVLSWIGDLASVAEKLVKLDFYRGVLKVTQAFAEDRLQLLDGCIESRCAHAV